MYVNLIQPKKIRNIDYKIAIVRSNFYEDISDRLLKGALDYIGKNEGKDDLVSVFDVYGAYEMPFMCKKLIENIEKKTMQFDGIVVLGCLIRGESAHFNYISGSIIDSIAKLNITGKVPISLGLLTVYNRIQALERSATMNNVGYGAISALHDLIEVANYADNNTVSIRKDWRFNRGFNSEVQT